MHPPRTAALTWVKRTNAAVPQPANILVHRLPDAVRLIQLSGLDLSNSHQAAFPVLREARVTYTEQFSISVGAQLVLEAPKLACKLLINWLFGLAGCAGSGTARLSATRSRRMTSDRIGSSEESGRLENDLQTVGSVSTLAQQESPGRRLYCC
jgi:hypothetical protein